jgi:DNA-binding transcriptional LysR family regulator
VIAASSPPRDLEPLALRSVGQKVVLPSAHPLAARRSLRPADLAGEKMVVAPAGSPHRVMLEQALTAAGAALQVAVEATGWELMLQFARYGVGLAVVNDFCPEPKGMAGVPLAGVPSITYYLIGRLGAGGPGAEAMRKLIVETVSRDGQ